MSRTDLPFQDALEVLIKRFEAGGCCGKRPTLMMKDLEAVELTPVPAVFHSSMGQIIPSHGWRAMCVYVYESLVGKPFPQPPTGEEWGDVVAKELREIVIKGDIE